MSARAKIVGTGRSIAIHAGLAVSLIALLVVGLGAYAANIEIAGAVVASATVEVQSYAKRIQHQDGGTIAAIYVDDDQQVRQGDLLVRLDDTELRATVILAEQQLAESRIEQARLSAELNGARTFAGPDLLGGADPATANQLLDRERRTLAADLAARDGKTSQLLEQVTELNSQIDGLDVQRTAALEQVDNISAELKGMASLSDQKLVLVSKVNDLTKAKAYQEGEVGRLAAAIAEAKATIAERQYQVDQIQSDFASQALTASKTAWQNETSAQQQLTAASVKLARVEIRAPQSGVIHESQVHTVGGVVTPGEEIMEIVPVTDTLVFRARIDLDDIDQVRAGQSVRIRLTSFDRRSTPELAGTVMDVSPDFVQQQGQKPYYEATVRVDDASLKALPSDVRLQPGIPAEVFVVTGERTVLSYLLHPFAEQLQLAMRDG